MLSLDIDSFMLELKDGSLKNVGPADKTATVKLYDVDGVEVREFGDKRVKLAFTDDAGSEVEVALFPEAAEEVARGVERLKQEGSVSE